VTREKLGKLISSSDVARTFFRLGVPVEDDEDYVKYLLNQAYDFCFACIKDVNVTLDRPLLRCWYHQGLG
jgi:hypothetical protein